MSATAVPAEPAADLDPHPTREEWAARQDAGPLELAAILADIRARRAWQDAEAAARRKAEDDATAARQEAFTAGLRSILAAEGCEFLLGYANRWAPCDAKRWGPDTRAVDVTIDATSLGLWPIGVFLALDTGGAGEVAVWAPACSGGNYTVRRPDRAEKGFHSLLEAVAEASLYSSTPF